MRKLILCLIALPFAASAAVVGPDTVNAPVANAAAAQAQGQDQFQGQAQGQLQGQGQNQSAIAISEGSRSASLSAAGAIAGAESGSTSTATVGDTSSTSTSASNSGGNAQTMTYNEAEPLKSYEVRGMGQAYAPNIYPSAPCAMAGSVGASALGWGVSAGGSKVNKECEQRETARMLSQLGYEAQGLAVLCSSETTIEVFGTREACMNFAARTAPIVATPAPVVSPVAPVKTTTPFGQ